MPETHRQRPFASKDSFVLAFVETREQRWTPDLVEASGQTRGSDPRGAPARIDQYR